jgi:hypothetical protein
MSYNHVLRTVCKKDRATNSYTITDLKKYTAVPIIKVKGTVEPRTGHEGPQGEYRYSSTLSLTSALNGGGWSTPRPVRFTPTERPGAHCIGGWVGPMAGLDR